MANKVTIFGAGSVVFSLGLVKDFVSDQGTDTAATSVLWTSMRKCSMSFMHSGGAMPRI